MVLEPGKWSWVLAFSCHNRAPGFIYTPIYTVYNRPIITILLGNPSATKAELTVQRQWDAANR